MTANATALAASTERGVPSLVGFNLAFLGLEIRRMMRNRRTMIFVLIFPAVFYCVIALQQPKAEVIAPGSAITVRAYLMVSLAVYGAMTACASGGGMVAVERALGWFLIPLGRATLYVFIMHVVLIAVVANIPALQQQSIFLNTVAYAVVLGLLWVMVRTRFLFRIIPT